MAPSTHPSQQHASPLQLLLLLLCGLSLVVAPTAAQSPTPSPLATVWPQGLTNLELWTSFPLLEALVTSGGRLREADLGVRLALLPQHEGLLSDATHSIDEISDCKCRVECQADPECVAFTHVSAGGSNSSGSGAGSCRIFHSRQALGVDVNPPNPDAFSEFKILSAAMGDVCFLDLECERRTPGSACDRGPDPAVDDPGTCQCAGGLTFSQGACVDPGTLTTTAAPTTSTTTQTTTTSETTTTSADTTTSTATTSTTEATTTTTAAAAVQTPDLTLADLTSEAEWPCDGDDSYCNFQSTLAEGGAAFPAFWGASMDAGVCGANSRCTFPAQMVDDSGVRRVEAWRGVGRFTFQMADDFPMAPADLSGGYNAGSANGNEAWRYDCTSSPGDNHFVMTGILGIYRTDHFNKNIPQDIDEMLCTRFAEVHLVVNPSGGQPMDITNNGAWECQPGMVVTGLYDHEPHFLVPKRAKCAPLTTGSLTTDCVMTEKHPASNPAIYWNACPQGPEPRVVTGMTLQSVPSDDVSKMWTLKCCKVTGPGTSLTAV